MQGRPNLYTSYRQEMQLLPTHTQKTAFAVLAAVLVLMPFELPVLSSVPVVRFLGDDEWLRPMSHVMVFAIAALGLNILSGVAGQVSLGHAFFMGVGACTAVYLGGGSGSSVWGHSLPVWVWLPGAGVSAALVGVAVSPVAMRLRGLYLAVVTLGLVFLGLHFGNTDWGRRIAGPPGLGRRFPDLDVRLWKEAEPLVDMAGDGRWLWFEVSDYQKRYWFLLALLAVFTLVAENLTRTRAGRAMQAIRDRDIAAEVMGVPEFRYKLIAFGVSSFYAGVAGALFAELSDRMLAIDFNLFLSVEFFAILLIGGIGTTAGPLVGAFFVVMLPKFVEKATEWLARAEVCEKATEWLAEPGGCVAGAVSSVLLTEGDDFGLINTSIQTPGWSLSVFSWNVVLFGVLIVVFLIAEPLGLFGVWVRIRNYWKQWPFSY